MNQTTQNESKKPTLMMIAGLVLITAGLAMRKRPEDVRMLKAGIRRGINDIKSRIFGRPSS